MSTTPARESGSVGFNLGAIFLTVVLGGIALAYAIDAAGRANTIARHGDPEVTLSRTIGDKNLEIPASWFRYAEQRVEGFAKQIDLQLLLPLGANGEPAIIEVTLLPRSRVRPSASLLDGVYLHQFEAAQVDGPPGLVGKPLKAESGLDTETVWYDALSSEPFVAKCAAPVAEGTEARCLRTVHLGPGIAAIYAFGANVLENWRAFDPQMLAALKQIGV